MRRTTKWLMFGSISAATIAGLLYFSRPSSDDARLPEQMSADTPEGVVDGGSAVAETASVPNPPTMPRPAATPALRPEAPVTVGTDVVSTNAEITRSDSLSIEQTASVPIQVNMDQVVLAESEPPMDEVAVSDSRDPNCLALGITAPNRDCSVLARAQSALKHADLAFNDPETMILNEPELLVLALEPRPGEDVATALIGTAGEAVVVRDRPITYHMRAELTSPDHFEIDPSGPQERTITTFARTTWEWTVKPIVEGPNRRLRLKVWGILEDADGNPTDEFEVETLNAQIHVDVTLGQRISMFVGSLPDTGLRSMGLGLAGLLTLLLVVPRVSKRFDLKWPRTSVSVMGKDLFVSYSRKDKKRVRRLVELFEQNGMSVAWDNHFLPGSRWRKSIVQALESSRAVVVLWSRHSVESHWVMEEASYAQQHDKLVPARLDDVNPPMGFGEVQTFNLAGSGPNQESASPEEFVSSVREVLDSKSQLGHDKD